MGEIYRKAGSQDRRLTVIATRDELPLVHWDGPIIITGVGALNVMRALMTVSRGTPILNVGYCGAGKIPVGTAVEIAKCDLFHPNTQYDEPSYVLGDPAWKVSRMDDRRPVTCHTITDFGGDPELEDCVFDMELAFILGMGFTDVKAVKVVSDRCNYKEYKKTIKKQ